MSLEPPPDDAAAWRALARAAASLRRMPDRFGQVPPRIARALYWLSITAYVGMIVVGVIAATWPASRLTTAELAFGRLSAIAVIVTATWCLASYPLHRWRWEMLGTWALGIALAVLGAVIVSVDPLADRGLLAVFAVIIVVGVYVRALQLLAFAHQTTSAARRQQWWNRRLRAGE